MRKTDKNNTAWIALVRQKYEFAVSVITKYEIYAGATESQLKFWDNVLQSVKIIPLDEATINAAVEINKVLKQKRKQIDFADLFIAATAITHDMVFATLNKRHFERIDTLNIID